MVASTCDSDHDLRFLLDLDGLTYHMTAGYWVKFNVWLIEPCKEIPHGIKYSLTLPDKNNVRIVGYDNAHGSFPKQGRYRAKKVTWDHVHRKHKVIPYEFDSASQLLEDFWKTVEEYI